MALGLFTLSRKRPALMRRLLRRATQRQLPAGYDVDTHFNPSYNPWDQRMCLVPDGDLFEAISAGDASVVTGHDRHLHRDGLLLADGRRARRGHRDHGDRSEPARVRRHRARGRRPRGRPRGDRRLQGHDAQRRPELRLRSRLHQRVVDAEGRPRRANTSAGCSDHMRIRGYDAVTPPSHRTPRSPRSPSSTSPRATCSARWTASRARAP